MHALRENGRQPAIGCCSPFRNPLPTNINCAHRLARLFHSRRTFPYRAMPRPFYATFAILIAGIFAVSCPRICAQTSTDEEQIGRLVAGYQWADVVRHIESLPGHTANLDFYYGSALAHLGRLADAEKALADGQRLAPRDPRFPTELAGIAFQQKRYPRAAQLLRRALRLDPRDSYSNNFLGTVYFLEGNQQASLKFWNRIGKPRIAAVRQEPTPHILPALLDHAFSFAPASTLTLEQLLDSETRIRALGIFPQFQDRKSVV